MAQEYLPEGATTLTTWKLADNTAGTGWASGATLNIDALGAQSIQGASLNQGATAAIATFTIGPLFSGTIGNGTSPMLFEATTGFYNAATGGTIYWGSKSSGGDPDATTNYTHTGASTMNITEGTVTTLEQAAGFVNVGTSAIVTNHKQSGGVTEYTAGSTAITSLIMTGGRCICHRQITAFYIYGGTLIYDVDAGVTATVTTAFVAPAGSLDYRSGDATAMEVQGKATWRNLKRSATITTLTTWSGASLERTVPSNVTMTITNPEVKIAGGVTTSGSASGGVGV